MNKKYQIPKGWRQMRLGEKMNVRFKYNLRNPNSSYSNQFTELFDSGRTDRLGERTKRDYFIIVQKQNV